MEKDLGVETISLTGTLLGSPLKMLITCRVGLNITA